MLQRRRAHHSEPWRRPRKMFPLQSAIIISRERIRAIESVSLTAGIASLQLNPSARIDEAVSQVPRFNVSVAQYAIHVQIDQVWFSGLTGSMSSLVHTWSGARADACLGSCQAETVVQRAFSCCLVGMYRMLVKSFMVEIKLVGTQDRRNL